MSERVVLGKGFDHIVLQAKNPDMVLKVPYGLNALTIFANPDKRVAALREELRITEELGNLTGILVPQTRIIPFGRGYVIAQKKLVPNQDCNMEKISNQLGKFTSEYDFKTANFIMSDDIIYNIDPFKGVVSRIMHKFGNVPMKTWRKSTALIRKMIWRLKSNFSDYLPVEEKLI